MSSLLSFCLIPFRTSQMFMYVFAIIAVTAIFNMIWNLIK